MATQPSFYIPHGGGPCFFMPDPSGNWTEMGAFLRGLPATLAERPKAIIVVSGHWETEGFAFTGAEHPSLIYDYSGFPADTYQLRYDVPGAPDLARQAAELLCEAGLAANVDPLRGLDHGVFVPLKVAFPDADIPLIEMSVDLNLDPRLHLAAGEALAPLRDEGRADPRLRHELPQYARLRRPTRDSAVAGVRPVADRGRRAAGCSKVYGTERMGGRPLESLLASAGGAFAAAHGRRRCLEGCRYPSLQRTRTEDRDLGFPLRLTFVPITSHRSSE